MPGVLFVIVIPTANFERELTDGIDRKHETPLIPMYPQMPGGTVGTMTNLKLAENPHGNNNLNINLADRDNAILRLEVELRDKNAAKNRRIGYGGRGPGRGRGSENPGVPNSLPLEKILEELLGKLEIYHVTWTISRKGYFHQVVFPLQSGEPCETTLHCLTQLGIGVRLQSSVSVLPCSVTYDAMNEEPLFDEEKDNKDLSKWNNFVESIKSKLTVKQVVDGVRAGGSLSFDYLLLIVTADSLAALGLVENNASNIVAAMLVSPLMGPVMSITFGTIISDRELMRVGFITLVVGMGISLLFGFLFGLILGTTEMPWGSGDWPTEEMRGRGNARSLWMGVLWALTSGTGVAVALLQGSAGPLIGVAISASLLPPVVNCGLFWALACIWLIYPDVRIPHLKGEDLSGNSSYPFLYTDYLPTEFAINGIVSCLLTVVNVICIFITAVIVLKIKEVSAPYTASPDLKRFWETDLRTVRKTNRSTIRRPGTSTRDRLLGDYQGAEQPRNHELDTVLEQALKEAEEDVTFKKIRRMSYSGNAAGEITQRLAKIAGLNTLPKGGDPGRSSRMNSIRNSKINADLKSLDNLVSVLLHQHGSGNGAAGAAPKSDESGTMKRKSSAKFNRWRPTSRSAHTFNFSEGATNYGLIGDQESGGMAPQHAALMPTIMESGLGSGGEQARGQTKSVQDVLHSLNNNSSDPAERNEGLETPTSAADDEIINLRQNML